MIIDYLYFAIYVISSVFITTRHSKTIFLGDWSSWQEWGGCTVSCGGGIQNRHRLCLNPTPMHGGLPCSMDGSKNVELRTCNVNMCPGMYEISVEKVPSVTMSVIKHFNLKHFGYKIYK